ncbi:zinc finger CCHC domain-containing protein 7-like isoform X2 [Melanotaenia boesemani]|uniref:zinc finger CCHC domain-containing protein 7-like isoform X2 n=1 Tax=Melanotaenia boesemani TaxID=1250792 RepID=UPI001C03C32B|nr:zinc finger CCHC domain-containing protein 7-like isoform X2 [Melanotaenia boesemani]
MNYFVENEVNHGQARAGYDLFFIEDSRSSESSDDSNYGYPKRLKPGKQTIKLSKESSPPLLLAFSSSGKALHDTCRTSSTEEQEESSDQSIEEWMILGGEEQVGDSNIQLNLSYWSSEDDNIHKDRTNESNKSIADSWVVSDKDKNGADHSLASRYFGPSCSSICPICNRMGHVAKSCYLYRKCPVCVLCGIRGHIQRDCPARPCPSCGLPSHGLDLCKVPPVWNQHCQRCGMTGHLSDACPDTWRQYHLTIRLDVPHKPQTVGRLTHRSRKAHCYNCSKTGHYGHECMLRRMVSGTFPSLPYICHYDTIEDILQRQTRVQKGAIGGSDEENPSVKRRSRIKQEANSQAGRRRTWPERRKEKRQVKRLRREARAMRERGLLGRSCCSSDNDVCPANSFRHPLHGHKQSISPSEKRRTDKTAGRKSRKSREAERWKKRGGIKRSDLYPQGDMDIRSENLLSPNKRVHHRRR